jgi:SNF2 family DNA or RNA helicase
VLLAHPDSAGHGLNLQRGGHIIIWFGLTWSFEKYQQANARLHRQGQDRPVTVYHVIAAGTMDEKVLRALAAKDLRQEALIDAVKGLLLVYSRDGAVSQAAGGQDRAPARES